jgi:hypothetical protein
MELLLGIRVHVREKISNNEVGKKEIEGLN